MMQSGAFPWPGWSHAGSSTGRKLVWALLAFREINMLGKRAQFTHKFSCLSVGWVVPQAQHMPG